MTSLGECLVSNIRNPWEEVEGFYRKCVDYPNARKNLPLFCYLVENLNPLYFCFIFHLGNRLLYDEALMPTEIAVREAREQ